MFRFIVYTDMARSASFRYLLEFYYSVLSFTKSQHTLYISDYQDLVITYT